MAICFSNKLKFAGIQILHVKFALGSGRPSIPLHWKKSAISRRFANARRAFYATFSTEIAYLKGFMNEYPFLTLGIVFFGGLIVGGVLRARTSQFVILTLLGGFALAIAYGSSIGLPTFLSSLLVVPVDAFTTYAAVRIIRAIERYPRAEPYLTTLKNKYAPGSRFLIAHTGRLGLGGALALATLLVGWWVTVAIAYLLDVDVSTTMKATLLGLLAGAGVSWAVYEGLTKALPNQILVTAVTLIVFGILAHIIRQMARREPR